MSTPTPQIPRRRRFHPGISSLAPLTAEGLKAIQSLNAKRASGTYTEVHHDCPCGRPDDEVLATRERFGIEMTTVICRSCGMVRTDPMLSDAAWDQFYTHEYLQLFGSQYGERKGTLEQIYKEERQRGEAIYKQHFAELLAGRRGLRVADIGCGTGGVLRIFTDHGHGGVGCDVNADTCAYGRKMGLDVVTGDARVLAQRGPFDVVILSHILEHVTEPNPFLAMVRGMMADGGYLYIALPSVMDLSWKRYRWDILRFLRFYHPYSYCLGTLTQVVGRHGFTLVRGSEWIQVVFQAQPPGAAPHVERSYYAETMRCLRRSNWYRLLRGLKERVAPTRV